MSNKTWSLAVFGTPDMAGGGVAPT